MAQLVVNGFTGHLLALNGSYSQAGDNHGKPTYKKRAEMDGTSQCCVYFWDERDGAAMSGWWIAPEVGGEQVWSHCQNSGPTPPPKGWKVPWHTQTPDNRVTLELKQAGGAAQGGAWGQQSGPQKRAFEGNQNAGGPPQKYPRQGGYQGHQGQDPRANQQKGEAGRPGPAQNQAQQGGYGANRGGAWGQNQGGAYGQQHNQQAAAHEGRQRQEREKKLAQITANIASADSAVNKLNSKDALDANFDKQKHVQMARSAISTAQRFMDTHVRQGGLDEAALAPSRNKLKKFEIDCQKAEEAIKVEQAKKLEQIKTSYAKDLTALVVEAEKLVEETKDAAVLFTCEMAEHIKPDETIAAKEKTDAKSTPATEAIKKCRELIGQKDKELRLFTAQQKQPILDSIKPVQARLTTADKELSQLKNQAMNAFRKAQLQIAKEKKEKEIEEARVERERVNDWNKEGMGFCFQITAVADEMSRSIAAEEKTGEELEETEASLLGLQKVLKERLTAKECQNAAKGKLNGSVNRIESHLKKVRSLLKEQKAKDDDKVRRASIKLAAILRGALEKGEQNLEEYFKAATLNTNKMDKAKFERLVSSFDIEDAPAALLFKEACKTVGSDCSTLDKEAFSLHVANAYHSVMKPTPLTKEVAASSEKIINLDKNMVVQVLEGPFEEKNAMRVKLSVIKKDGEVSEGYANLRVGGEEILMKYSPHYTVLSETVLTDTFELKGFKVIRRIKAQEKFRSIGIPMYNKESDMWRINGVTAEKENVWVTIQGNRGTSLLRNEPMAAISAAADKPTEAKEFSEEKLDEILATMADQSRMKVEQEKDACEAAVVIVSGKLVDLENMDAEGMEPTLEEVNTACQDIDAAFKDYESKNHAVLRSINSMQQNIRSVEKGAYSDLKAKFLEYSESLREGDKGVKDMNTKRRQVSQSIRSKEAERRQAKERKEQEEKAAALSALIPPKTEAFEALQKRFTATTEVTLPRMMDSITDYQLKVKSTMNELTAIKESCGDLDKWIVETIPEQPKGALGKPVGELKKMKTLIFQLNRQTDMAMRKQETYKKEFLEKLRVDLSVSLIKYLETKKLTIEDYFKKITKDSETMTLEQFDKFVKSLVKGLESTEDLVKTAFGPITEITADHLESLKKSNYRCLKRCLMTDIIDIKSCKRLRAIEKDDAVEIIESHVVCPQTDLVRFKARAEDGTQGYVTIRGNKNSHYLSFQQPWYKVVKETVMTNMFEMKDFKPLRRLKEGEYVRSLSTPVAEEKSGLLRMKAQCVDEATLGWVTLKGSAGSMYLINCDIPADSVFEKKVKAEEKKEEVAEEKKEEDVKMEE